MPHTVAAAAVEQIQCGRGVVGVIAARLAHRLRRRHRRGQVHDGVESAAPEQRIQAVAADVGDDQFTGQHRLAHAAGQVVANDEVVAVFRQRQHDMTADITGAAGHQHFHRPLTRTDSRTQAIRAPMTSAPPAWCWLICAM